jgi:hypothetical protein
MQNLKTYRVHFKNYHAATVTGVNFCRAMLRGGYKGVSYNEIDYYYEVLPGSKEEKILQRTTEQVQN